MEQYSKPTIRRLDASDSQVLKEIDLDFLKDIREKEVHVIIDYRTRDLKGYRL